MERSMDGGGTLAPHPPMDDDGGGLLSVGWGAKLPDAVALDARDGLRHLDFKGRPSQWKWKDEHHGGRAGQAIAMAPRSTSGRPDPRPSTPVGFLLGLQCWVILLLLHGFSCTLCLCYCH